MPYPQTQIYSRLLDQILAIPVIDCHEHLMGPEERPRYNDPITALIQGYVQNDLESAAFGIPASELKQLFEGNGSTDERWPLFEKLWHATQHTAYARVTKLVLKNTYGIEGPLTREALEQVAEKLQGMDEQAYFRIIEQANIRVLLVDVLGWLPKGLGSFLDGRKTFPDKWRLFIPLPNFHPTRLDFNTVNEISSLADKHITSLEEYLEAVFIIFQRCIARGTIGIKDQSAYERILDYDLPPKCEAEKLFNQLLVDPHNALGWPESKPLNDFLFHQFMHFARELKLPVQLHTGHMAGIRNRVDKTNAAYLASVLELHREVRFDLFHGNWPYLGDLLFLGKNYPNVALDCCWLHIIDPHYAIELLERSVLTLPHTKVHGFGGDYGDVPEYVAGHLRLARQNIAAALMNLIEGGWLEEEQAISLAKDWLFNNPNRFFDLGFGEI